MEAKEYNRLRTQARRNAWQMLQDIHFEEFSRLHDIARADLGLEPTMVAAEAVHGTRSKYNSGCRCEPCTVANRDYQRGYMRLWREGISMKDPISDY